MIVAPLASDHKDSFMFEFDLMLFSVLPDSFSGKTHFFLSSSAEQNTISVLQQNDFVHIT